MFNVFNIHASNSKNPAFGDIKGLMKGRSPETVKGAESPGRDAK